MPWKEYSPGRFVDHPCSDSRSDWWNFWDVQNKKWAGAHFCWVELLSNRHSANTGPAENYIEPGAAFLYIIQSASTYWSGSVIQSLPLSVMQEEIYCIKRPYTNSLTLIMNATVNAQFPVHSSSFGLSLQTAGWVAFSPHKAECSVVLQAKDQLLTAIQLKVPHRCVLITEWPHASKILTPIQWYFSC